MNRMKAAAPPNGNLKDQNLASNSNLQLRSGQFQYSAADQQQPQPPLANYTLPGVISYLTLEFTNLERFKIMTNLEKSEMKYRIQQLTAEVNSLKFLNDKQALRITELEERLESAKTEDRDDQGSDQVSTESFSEKTGQTAPKSSKNAVASKPADYDIPPVDLAILRTSRQKLNRSIKDVFRLLKPPSMLARNVMDIPGSEHGTNQYDELLDIPTQEDEAKNSRIESMFAKYTLNSDDLLVDQQASFEEDSNNIMGALEEDNLEEVSPANFQRHGLAEESDTETVIVDEPEEAKLLTIDESELVNSNPEPPIKLGSVVHVSAAFLTAAVFKPFQHSFVIIQDKTLKVWHRSTQILSGEIKESFTDVVSAFYLEKKRVLLVTNKGEVMLIEQKPDLEILRRVCLHKEESLLFNTASIVEFTRIGSNRVLGLALTGTDADGQSNILALEIKVAQKVSCKPLANFDHTSLKVSSKVSALHWCENMLSKQHTTGLPKSVLPKKHRKLVSVDEDSLLEFDILFAHDKLLRVNLALKEVADLYSHAIDWVDFAEGYALLGTESSVSLFDLAVSRVVLTQPTKNGSQYSLLYKDSPYVVQVDNEIHVYDSTSREVATGPNPEGGLVYCDGDFLVVHSKEDVKITAIEGTN